MFQAIYNSTLGSRLLRMTLVAGCVLSVFASCKKQMREELYPSSLTIVNGVNDNTSFINAYFGDAQPKIYARLAFIKHGDYFGYATNKTDQPVRLFRNYDTLHFSQPFLQTRLSLEPGGIYTFFVYGNPGAPKQKTVKEQIPARSLSDSVVHLRIINFFENRAIDVVQLEPEAKTMISNLAYEQLTGFIKVPVNASVKNFRFEVKDHATGTTIATLTERNTFPGATQSNENWLFKARTMVVTGTWTAPGNYSGQASSVGHF